MPKLPQIKFGLKKAPPFFSLQRLVEEKKELEQQLKNVNLESPIQGAQRSLDAESVDEGEETVKMTRTSAIALVLQRTLRSIKISLKKAKHGSYGICDRCGKSIDPARLKAMPNASYCLECAKIVEEKQGV